MNRRRFLLTAISLLLLLHVYIGARLLPDLALGSGAMGFGIVYLTLSALLIPLGFIAPRRMSPAQADLLAWPTLMLLGFGSSLFVLTLLRDLGLLLAWPFASSPDLTALAQTSARAVPLMAGLLSLVGLFNARRLARVVEIEIPIAGLPEALRNFSIVQISDIHVGPTIKRDYLDAIVHRVNQLQPDLIAITGDLVDGRVEHLAHEIQPLARLSATHGAFFVTGNHEYYSGVHGWLRELERLHVQVLMNEHRIIRHRGGKLLLAGVTDYSAHVFEPSHRSDPIAALHGAPQDVAARILLAHQPRSCHVAAQAGYDLQLSGHTHGGQFLPWNFFVPLQQPFVAGLQRVERMWLYISRGTGYWGPPKRLGAPSEITRIRLVPAQGAT